MPTYLKGMSRNWETSYHLEQTKTIISLYIAEGLCKNEKKNVRPVLIQYQSKFHFNGREYLPTTGRKNSQSYKLQARKLSLITLRQRPGQAKECVGKEALSRDTFWLWMGTELGKGDCLERLRVHIQHLPKKKVRSPICLSCVYQTVVWSGT